MILKWYIKFLDKVLPGFIPCPALFQIVLEFRNELATKLPQDQ